MPANARDSSNEFPSIKIVTVFGYSYETEVQPNTKITFHVYVATNCTGDSDAAAAPGQYESEVTGEPS